MAQAGAAGRLSLLFCLLLSPARADSADAPPRRSPDEVLLIYNSDSPVSKAVADDYAEKRKITNILSIECPDTAVNTDKDTIPADVYMKDVANETISFDTYVKSVETPVRDYLAKHDGINFIVLAKGIPIRVTNAETGENSTTITTHGVLAMDQSYRVTSLDSHLAALDYKELPEAVKIHISGSGVAGIGWLNRYWNAKEPFTHAKFGGYLVTRLDGYTEADAKALVSRALAAEQGLTYGKVLLDVQPIFQLGDKATQPVPLPKKDIPDESPWSDYNADMQHAHDILVARGIPDELDLTEKFIGSRSNLLGYFSFGSNDARFSHEGYEKLSFAPGSIGDTAVSTSARSFLPTRDGQSMIADLIAHGLTGAKGYMDEPLLQAISSPTIVLDRYTSGYTLAESFYAGSHFVGWQDIVIGDPLCCPFLGGAEGKVPSAPAPPPDANPPPQN